MINAEELRAGNFVVWNPKLTDADTTLLPMVVEVASVANGEIGYNSPRIEHRAEPFEDDVLQQQSPRRPVKEFEPIPLNAETLSRCGFQEGSRKSIKGVQYRLVQNGQDWTVFAGDSSEKPIGSVSALHRLQNLLWHETGEDLSVDF